MLPCDEEALLPDAPPPPAIRRGRETVLTFANAGAGAFADEVGFVPLLSYETLPPGIHTFFLHAEPEDPALNRANVGSLLQAELEFGVGGTRDRVRFDARNAVVSVPCEGAALRARYLTDGQADANQVASFRFRAFACPGAHARPNQLLLTTEELTVPNGGDSVITAVPAYAYGVAVLASTNLNLVRANNIALRGVGGLDGATALDAVLVMDETLVTGGWASMASATTQFYPLNGAIGGVHLRDLGANGGLPFRLVFALRL